MKKLYFISLTFFLLISCNSNELQQEETVKRELPNIIMLVGDDQGYPYFGFMGTN